MSSLRNAVTSNTFGKKMPTVIVDKIEVDFLEGKPDHSSATIDVYVSISFTKPDHMQAGTFEKAIKGGKIGSELYLYSYLIHGPYYYAYGGRFPLGETAGFILDDLNNNKFSLGNWFVTEEPKYSVKNREACFKKYKFADLIDSTVFPDSTVSVGTQVTANGKEIVTFSGIKIRNLYDGSNYPHWPRLLYTDIMYMAFTGLDNEEIFSTDGSDTYAYHEQLRTGRNNLTNNMFFGDITYHKVLEKNKVRSKFYQAYTDQSGIPYDGPVLQSVNGGIYATDEFSFDDVKAILQDMISEFSENRVSDSELNTNIESLEAIINAVENSAGVLGELATYRSTYPNKNAATSSGEFYRRFILVLQQLISSVESQPQLSTSLLYDSLIIDKRFSLVKDSGYSDPELDNGIYTSHARDVVSGVPYSEPSDCFIPSKWFLLARTSFKSALADNNMLNREGLGIGEVLDDGTTVNLPAYNELFDESERGDKRDNLIALYEGKGFSTEIATELANQQMDYSLVTGESTEILNLIDSDSDGELTEYVETGDIQVKHQGIFVFDYEKAIRTKSKISKIFDTSKLELLMRYKIPYNHFYMTSTELSRNELRIPFVEDRAASNRYIRTKLKLNFKTPEYVKGINGTEVPYNGNNDIRYSGASPVGETDSEFYLERLRYLRPYTTNTFSHGNSSYLLSFNCDLPQKDPLRRLEKYNSMDEAGTTGFDSLSGARVIDGYRLIHYKFQEFMDDDVAFHNTTMEGIGTGTASTPKRQQLMAGNGSNRPRTQYGIVVQLVDRTCRSYEALVNTFVNYYNAFIEYYEKAKELCSYNNIENTFNQWFMDQVNDLFPDKPWVRAAHGAQILSELIFAKNNSISEIDFESSIMETIIKISPETGTLPQLDEFASQFNVLMQYIRGAPYTDDGPPAHVGTPYKKYLTLRPGTKVVRQFYNEKDIWEPIAGITVSDEPTIDVDLKLPVMFTIIRDVLTTGFDDDTGKFRVQTHSDVAYKVPGQPVVATETVTIGGTTTELTYSNYDRIYSVNDEPIDPLFPSSVNVSAAEAAHEVIWLPTSDDGMRYNFFNQAILPDDRGYREDYYEVVTGGGGFTNMDIDKFRADVGQRLAMHPKEFNPSYTGQAATMMQWWLERIMSRTTVDNKINTKGNGARRRWGVGTTINTRRHKRYIGNCFKALAALSIPARKVAGPSLLTGYAASFGAGGTYHTRDNTRKVGSIGHVANDNDYSIGDKVPNTYDGPMVTGANGIAYYNDAALATIDAMMYNLVMFTTTVTGFGYFSSTDAGSRLQDLIDQKEEELIRARLEEWEDWWRDFKRDWDGYLGWHPDGPTGYDGVEPLDNIVLRGDAGGLTDLATQAERNGGPFARGLEMLEQWHAWNPPVTRAIVLQQSQAFLGGISWINSCNADNLFSGYDTDTLTIDSNIYGGLDASEVGITNLRDTIILGGYDDELAVEGRAAIAAALAAGGSLTTRGF